MVRLPDPERSFVVLIGTSAYRSAELPDLPAVRDNLSDLVAVLTDPAVGGLPSERCITVPDSDDVRDVYRILREYAGRAEDTLVVYFAGHGFTGLERHELYLALADTDLNELPVSALAFDLIRRVFRDCPATNRVLILDCCFSGRAAQGFMASPTEAMLGQVEVAGTYTLTATSANALASAPPGARNTAFTGELLTLLRSGIPDEPELLTLSTIYRRLRHMMAIHGLPLPAQLGTGTADLLALARNRAYRPVPPAQVSRDDAFERTPTDTLTPPALVTSKPTRLARLVSIVFVATISATTTAIIFQNTGFDLPNIVQSRTTETTLPQPAQSSHSTPSPPSAASNPREIRVQVYNNSTIRGLAERAADDFRRDGWNAESSRNYAAGIIPTSTVYFRPGRLCKTLLEEVKTDCCAER